MKKPAFTLFILVLFAISQTIAQDTFSIVALDSITGEVGSAGASCVDMNNFPGYEDDFLGELFPALGAINTQAWYHETNQTNARERMNLGDTPEEIIQWLYDNDAQNQPEKRQYGIVAFVNESPQSAGFTGVQTDDYKNHVLGPNYSIQGNILLGQEILDSMEARFLAAEGDLACKLMAALQGAKVVGADTRCASNGSSSLFAFVKVAQPDDIFGDPSFVVSVRTSNGAGIEPIDSLQLLFDLVHECSSVGIGKESNFNEHFRIFPNPASEILNVQGLKPGSGEFEIIISDLTGNNLYKSTFQSAVKIDISNFTDGIYFLKVSSGENSFVSKFIKE
jgi:uncharacterized Ntn-hydrolase superfamily protein